MHINVADVILAARDLASDKGSPNGEYDRALIELCCHLLGVSTDERDRMERVVFSRP